MRGLALVLAVVLFAPAAVGAERVPVRVGEHPGFDRLVFDWARPVGVTLERDADEARLRFDRPAELDLKRLQSDPPPGLRAITAAPGPQSLSVTIALRPGAKLRLLESGAARVLDILKPETPLTAPPARPGGALGAPVPLAEITTPQAPAVAPTAPPAAEPPAGARKGAAPLSLLEPPAKREAEAEAETETPAVPAKAPTAKASPSEASKVPPPGRAKPEARAKPPAQKQAQKQAQKPVPQPEPQAAPRQARRLVVLAEQGPPLLDGTAVNSFDGLGQTMNNLRFQWDAEVGLAVFRRGEHLWLVFDAEAPGRITEGLVELAPELAPVDQFRAPDATLIRTTAPPILAPKIARDGNAWVLELWPRPPREKQAVRLELRGEREATGVSFGMKGPGRLVRFHDPGTGAPLAVLPARVAGQGIARPRAFPQFRVLSSAQGLALELTDEATQVAATASGALVTHPGDLLVSYGASFAVSPGSVPAPAVGPRLFDLESWRQGPEGAYFPQRQALQAALAAAGPAQVPAARLALARFQFAHGFASEAAGLVEMAKTTRPRLRVDPETRLMRGVAAFLAGDYKAAAEDLYHPSLSGEAEAALWHAAMAWNSFDWEVAAETFARHAHMIGAYPHAMRTRLRLMAAEAALGVQDEETAGRHLKAAHDDAPTFFEQEQIAVVAGYLTLQQGDSMGAQVVWDRIARFGQHRQSRTRARLALLDIAVLERSMSAEDAIAELERLRFAWRGDHIELAVLQRLGDLYYSQGRYRDSLRAFRQATVTVPNSRLAREVAQRMREVFYEVMTGERSDDIAPLQALALYEDYKELTPADSRGDILLSRLAERLEAVDLLPRAAELLTSLIRFRLSGEPKAAMGARTALIHLQDGEAEKAIAVLALSEAEALPEDLKRYRIYLRAEALALLSRYEEALALLAQDSDPEALRLRADLLWEQADWPAAAAVLSQLVPPEPRADRALSEDESRNVVDLAVALTLSGDEARLAALKRTYGRAMAEGPDRETFALLAASPEAAGERSIAEKLGQVAKAEDFMTRYRDRFQQASVN